MPVIIRNIFEEYCTETFNVQDTIAVNNGTSALIAPLWSMDLKPDDEVEDWTQNQKRTFNPWNYYLVVA